MFLFQIKRHLCAWRIYSFEVFFVFPVITVITAITVKGICHGNLPNPILQKHFSIIKEIFPNICKRKKKNYNNMIPLSETFTLLWSDFFAWTWASSTMGKIWNLLREFLLINCYYLILKQFFMVLTVFER